MRGQISAFGNDKESDHLDNWEVHLLGSGSVWMRDEKVGSLIAVTPFCTLLIPFDSIDQRLLCPMTHLVHRTHLAIAAE